MCKLQHDTTTVTSSTASRSSVGESIALFLLPGCMWVVKIYYNHCKRTPAKCQRTPGKLQVFLEAKLHLLHSFQESRLMEYSWVFISFFHALKQKRNHKCNSEKIFVLRTTLPVPKIIHVLLTGISAIYHTLSKDRSLAEVNWHCWWLWWSCEELCPLSTWWVD